MSQKYIGAMIGKIELGCKQLGIDAETRAAMVLEVTGKKSRKDCNARELGWVIDHLARRGAVFKSPSKQPYQARAGQRSDWYEIPDTTPQAAQKRLICALWRELGYALTSLDTRVKKQTGCERLLWCHDPDFLRTLAKDLSKRLERKRAAKVAEVG